MKLDRNKQEQVWTHKDFKKLLQEIKALRALTDNPVSNLGDLTKEMMDTPSFAKVKAELLRTKFKESLGLKIDKKGLFK